MINFVLNNYLGCPTFSLVNSVKITETIPASGSDVPEFFGALATNKGMVFFTDTAQSESTNFSFVSVPLAIQPGNILKYNVSSVNYFYYSYGNTIGLYSTGNSTVTNTYLFDSFIIDMSLTGTTLYVSTAKFIYQFSIGALGVLTQSGVNYQSNIVSIAALSSTKVFLGFSAGGYGIYDFSVSNLTISSAAETQAFVFKEAIVNNGYLVGTNNSSIYTELISTINSGAQVITSLDSLNLNGALTIRNLSSSQSAVVTLSTGNGFATFTASSNTIASFIRQSTIGNSNIAGLSFFDVTADGTSFLFGNGNSATIFKQYEKIYTWGTGPYISQQITRLYQGRLKILTQFPSASTAAGSVSLLDENQIPLYSWTIVAGKVTNSGIIGTGTNYCYWDAPLGITDQKFQISVTSNSSEIVKALFSEVP